MKKLIKISLIVFAVFIFTTSQVSAQTISESTQFQTPFQSVTIQDPELYTDQSVVVQAGSPGISTKTIETTTFFNKTISAKESFAVISLPVSEIIKVGIKPYPTISDNSGKLIFPCRGVVTATDKEGSHSGFTAIDVANKTGEPIYSPTDGIITMASDHWGYGNCIQMTSNDGSYSFLFGHLSDYNCEVGQNVVKGQIIGYIGNTGNSSGSHLHLEIYIDGVKQYIPNIFALQMGDQL